LIVVLLAGLAGMVGLVATCIARRRVYAGSYCDAIAVGVLVGLLVGTVPRLIGSATVVLARFAPGLQPVGLRSLAASIGPLVIQNLAAALVIGIYIISLRSQRRSVGPHAAERSIAPLFAVALGVDAVADGLAAAASSLPLTGSLPFTMLAGVALGHLCRGLALGGGLAAQSAGFGWLGTTALLGGLLGSLGGSLGRQLGFDQAALVAVPVMAGAVGLLVVLIAMTLGPGLGSNLKINRLPAAGFLGGLGATLVAAHLLA
jgi:hypothetical protein